MKTRRINPEPNYEKAIEEIIGSLKLPDREFKEKVRKIVGKVVADKFTDIIIVEE